MGHIISRILFSQMDPTANNHDNFMTAKISSPRVTVGYYGTVHMYIIDAIVTWERRFHCYDDCIVSNSYNIISRAYVMHEDDAIMVEMT